MPRTIPQIKRRVECNLHLAQSRGLPIPYPVRDAVLADFEMGAP
jgi:hypothetical protein